MRLLFVLIIFLSSCGIVQYTVEQQPVFTIVEIDIVNKKLSSYKTDVGVSFEDAPNSFKVGDIVVLSKSEITFKKQSFFKVDKVQIDKHNAANYHVIKSKSSENFWIMDKPDSFSVGDTLIFTIGQ